MPPRGNQAFLKGAKCASDRCPLEKRNFPPGQHGKDRKAKIVGYGLQLHEKQKAKRMYFTLEGQFREYYEKANRACRRYRRFADSAVGAPPGQRGLPAGLCHFAPSGAPGGPPRPVEVNGRKVNIPSFQVKVGDEIAIRDTPRSC
jgi:small subunit ribosomal protein S4